jgi:hypothetical protein
MQAWVMTVLRVVIGSVFLVHVARSSSALYIAEINVR